MKIFSKFAGIVTFSAVLVQGVQSQSLELLEAGSEAVVMSVNQTLTPQQERNALQFSMFVRGFLTGVSVGGMDRKGRPPVKPPPEWLYDPAKAAPSFLAFVKKSKPSGYDPYSEHGKTAFILMAWYLDQYPDSGYHKVMKEVMLKEFFQPEEVAK